MAARIPPRGTSHCSPELANFYAACCCGREDAAEFLLAWHAYCHEVDDLVDEGPPVPERLLRVLLQAAELYSLPFWRRHGDRLGPVVALVTNAYADSVAWERSATPELRTMADSLRFAGNEMVLAVAGLCGGAEAMRAASPWLRAMSWRSHHDATGQPV